MSAFREKWAPRLLSVLRIMAGLIFFEVGTSKILGFPPREHVHALLSLSGIAGIFEFFCGFLIVVGLFTRPAAFIASGEMAFAYFLSHAPKNFFPSLNGGGEAILFCFIFLYLAAAGGGIWSLDAYFSKKPSPATASV